MELVSMRKFDQERMDALLAKIDKLTESLLQNNEKAKFPRSQLSELTDLRTKYAELYKEKASLKEEL